jgi:CheY-like chemotaxis protein
MSPEQQARIFAPFSQGDGSNTKRFGGSGLGLAISRHLIDMMGGELSIKSTPGLGSCVTFTCQVKATGDTQLAAQPTSQMPASGLSKEALLLTAAPDLNGVRVLLVEDDKFNAMLALAFLNKLGMQARQAGNGQEAIEAIAQHTFDIVLMDLQMPELDGLNATRQIQARWGESAPPIVAMSAATQAEDLQDCIEAGMVDQISKPVELEVMKTVLQRCLRTALKPAVSDRNIHNTLDDIATARLGQLVDKLQQSLEENLTSARKLCDEITSAIEATALANEFRPVAEQTRRLKYKDALLALADFRPKIANKSH